MFHVKHERELQPYLPMIFGAQLDKAERYFEILADAGVVRGLIGPREVERLWSRHILNCALVAETFSPDSLVFDIGSGAGLPGIPLALARPDLTITLIEPLLRRATFLAEVIEELKLDSVTVVRGRAEDKSIARTVGLADAVTSRAVAPLDRLAGWCAPLIAKGGRLVALKGSTAEAEILEHRTKVGQCGIVDLEVIDCNPPVLNNPVLNNPVLNNTGVLNNSTEVFLPPTRLIIGTKRAKGK